MRWIKITHSTGISNLNLDLVSNIESFGPDSIKFYGNDLTSFLTLIFSSSAERDEIIFKLESYINVPNISNLVYEP